jgi:hypothetical protein
MLPPMPLPGSLSRPEAVLGLSASVPEVRAASDRHPLWGTATRSGASRSSSPAMRHSAMGAYDIGKFSGGGFDAKISAQDFLAPSRQILFALDASDRRKPQHRGRRSRLGSRHELPADARDDYASTGEHRWASASSKRSPLLNKPTVAGRVFRVRARDTRARLSWSLLLRPHAPC